MSLPTLASRRPPSVGSPALNISIFGVFVLITLGDRHPGVEEQPQRR